MVKIKKYANVVERFLHGEKGQRFFNFAYSIGAAIVIWGALFKILHLPGGSLLLCIGMGTEIAMFILTAFDRPPKEYAWEEVFPALDKDHHHEHQQMPMAQGFSAEASGGVSGGAPATGFAPGNGGGGYAGGYIGGYAGPVYPAQSGAVQGAPAGESLSVDAGAEFVPVGGNYAPATLSFAPGGPVSPQESAANALGLSEEDTESLKESINKMAAASTQLDTMAEMATATSDYLAQINGIAEQMAKLQETTRALNKVSETLLASYQTITGNADNADNGTSGYAAQMEDLTRNISGLNTIYSIQLKSISSQLESIDRVNRGLKDIRDMYEKSAHQSSRYCEETEKMARYMKQLNSVYEKMITAMTINMANPMMGAMPKPDSQANPFTESQQND